MELQFGWIYRIRQLSQGFKNTPLQNPTKDDTWWAGVCQVSEWFLNMNKTHTVSPTHTNNHKAVQTPRMPSGSSCTDTCTHVDNGRLNKLYSILLRTDIHFNLKVAFLWFILYTIAVFNYLFCMARRCWLIF